jgi:hypothetical protein
MSVLSIIQSHCKIHALNTPSSAIGSTDTNTIQLLEIINELLSEIVTESKFNVITQEATFSTIPADDQGAMSVLAPNGYFSAIFETFYDRTQNRPLSGPLSETEWQAMKALPSAGAFFKFRIRQDHLLLDPIPTDTSLIAFEYMSSWCVTDSQGNLKAAITADNDLFVFPENIIRKGMMFRWKQVKGLPYQADETQYYNLLNNYIAKDKVKRRIDVSGEGQNDLRPGIFVPSNSWLQ